MNTLTEIYKPLCLLTLFAALLLLAGPLRADTVQYAYDSAGRVTVVDYGNGRSVAYTYDRNGSLVRKTVTTITDTDHDGMDDAWEQLYFGNKEARDGTGDFDNDGFKDLNEFLAGTLPNNNTSLLKLTQATPSAGSGVNIQWASVPGKNYRVQFKNSLTDANWTDLPGDVLATGATSSRVDNTESGVTTRFYRVQLLP